MKFRIERNKKGITLKEEIKEKIYSKKELSKIEENIEVVAEIVSVENSKK